MFTQLFVSFKRKGKGKEGDREKAWEAERRARDRRVSIQNHGGRNCVGGAEVRESAGRPLAAIPVTT